MKKYTNFIVIGIVLIIIAFFGGKAYGSSHSKNAISPATARFGGARGAYSSTGAANGMPGATSNRGFGGGTSGTVIAKDATSITVSIPGGGSKIILVAPSTAVSKNASGSIDDVTVGSTVMATGTPNPDGSITASAIQIRPTASAKQ